MGAGGDCYYKTWTAEKKARIGGSANRYCASACGVASLKMGLATFNLDRPAKDLYCPGPLAVYVGAGSSYIKIGNVAKKLGLTNSFYKYGINWDDIVKNIREGKTVVLLMSDTKNPGPVEKSYPSAGHFMTLFGTDGEHVIANDPGRRQNECAEHLVFSKEYVTTGLLLPHRDSTCGASHFRVLHTCRQNSASVMRPVWKGSACI